MNSRQKHIIAALLGVEVGIALFIFFSTSPVLSAWIPGTGTPAIQSLNPELAVNSESILSSEQIPPAPAKESFPPSENTFPTSTEDPRFVPVFPLETSFSASTPPSDPTLLARSYPETFAQTPAIWAHNHEPVAHEIVLFRHAFEITQLSGVTELQIFADTRYEVWLDGKWIGRGPARFSCTLREYDVYPLETLTPGHHVIAVLVQWAPSARRSESNTPLLQARLQNYTSAGVIPLLQTGPDWKVYATSSWDPKADLVHNWELIGPMEWLDFRSLPQQWPQPEFVDTNWGRAVLTHLLTASSKSSTIAGRICDQRDIPTAFIPVYQPRTIPILTNTSITPTLIESGFLSPNRITIQPLPIESTGVFPFQATESIVFTVEFLSLSPSTKITDTVFLDGLPLHWLPAGGIRPDVWVGRLSVTPGLHTLTNSNLKAFPIFDVFAGGLRIIPPIIQPGHPGHRMLLAEPVPNDIPLSLLSGKALNFRIDQTPAYLVLELPHVVHGRLVAEVTGPPGTIVDIGWDEKRYFGPENHSDGRPLPFPGHLHPHWSQVDSWILDGNKRNLTTLDSRTGRYIVITVWGNGPVEFHNLHVLEERYPTTPRGEFISSNPLLNQVWQVGANTTRLNMIDAYADPWRERGQWWGDAYIVDRTNRVAFGDITLLRRGLLYMADGFKNGLPSAYAPSGNDAHMLDYGMLWVQSLDTYVTLTQDKEFAVKLYPTLQSFLNYLQKRTSGYLLSIPRAHWSRSNYVDTRATFSRYGQSAAINAMYYGTLLSAVNLAEMVSDTSSAENWRSLAENVKKQINTKLYNSKDGRYVSTLLYGRLYAPDPFAQAWPLAYDVVPEEEIPRVVAALLELLSTDPKNANVDIYGMNWVLTALSRNGHIPESLALIELYYGSMLEAGATTWWELFTSYERYTESQSHGWGSSPTWILTTYLLGGRWTGPNTWVIQPALQGVTSVSGSLPIGQNNLAISWEVQSCSLSEIEIRAPSHTDGELIIPFVDVESLTLNGAAILQNGSAISEEVSVQTDGVHVTLSKKPQYTFSITRTCPKVKSVS